MIKHGLCYHPLYRIYSDMKARCYRKTHKRFKDYGGRGIIICQEWLNDRLAFIQWSLNSGWKKGLQIDRIDNSGEYSPQNCHFVTPKENCENRRNKILVEVFGETMLLKEAVDKYSVVDYSVVMSRIYIHKWDTLFAILLPSLKGCNRRLLSYRPEV